MKFIMAPIAFSFLLAFVLYPVTSFLERKGLGRWSSLFITFFGLAFLIVGVSVLFSSQIIQISSEFSTFGKRIQGMLQTSLEVINQQLPTSEEVQMSDLQEELKNWIGNSAFLSNTLSSFILLISSLSIVIILSFIILLYQNSFVKVALSFAPSHQKEKYLQMLKSVQQVGQKYIYGLVLLIIILCVANSIGLLIVGIDYAIFFGVLAGVLCIIPYVGTYLGGVLPLVYALLHYDSYWFAIGVVIVFVVVQFVEGNFLNPIIVGGEVSINPFVSIIALIVGAAIWGIAGATIALPLTAIFKVICEYYEELRPISHFLGDEMFQEKKTKRKSWWTRLRNLFSSKKRDKEEEVNYSS